MLAADYEALSFLKNDVIKLLRRK